MCGWANDVVAAIERAGLAWLGMPTSLKDELSSSNPSYLRYTG